VSSAKKNPFEIFGLTPEMAFRLQEEDLFTLIKALYRRLHKVYHPDMAASRRGKADEQFELHATELNLAFEKLNLEKDRESFRYYHKLYAARRNTGLRKQISDLQVDIKKAEEESTILADAFLHYMFKEMSWRKDNQAGRARPSPRYPLFGLCNLKMGLNDVAINHNIRSCSWELGSNYKEILFDSGGNMSYRPVGRAKPFPVNYIHLLGTIEVGKIDLVPLLKPVPPRTNYCQGPLAEGQGGVDRVSKEVLNTMPLYKFKKFCLPLLQPELRERAYLFSIQRPVFEEEADVTLEGVIVKLS